MSRVHMLSTSVIAGDYYGQQSSRQDSNKYKHQSKMPFQMTPSES